MNKVAAIPQYFLCMKAFDVIAKRHLILAVNIFLF